MFEVRAPKGTMAPDQVLKEGKGGSVIETRA